LNRINMQQTTCFVDQMSGFGDWLNGAGFVIGQHDRDQRWRSLREHRSQGVEIH
jgi:hypothetical protein